MERNSAGVDGVVADVCFEDNRQGTFPRGCSGLLMTRIGDRNDHHDDVCISFRSSL